MKLFEDLPSTNTPINAENLNQIQDNLVVVSAIEPSGDNREKVWMQKGKNLIDISKVEKGYYSYDDNGNTWDGKSYATFDKIKVRPNTTYTYSRVADYSIYSQLRYVEFDENKQFISRSSASGTLSGKITFTTSENTHYIAILNFNANNTGSFDDITNVQIEQGLTATEYEEYIEPKMYVLNDNGVYEEFVNVSEINTSIQDIISKEFKFVGRGESIDFNSFTKNGFYQCNFQNGTNAPSPYAAGMLLVFGNYYIAQLYIADLNGTAVAYARMSANNGSSWNSWIQLG